MGASVAPQFMTPGPDAINALLAHLTGVSLPGVQQTPSGNNPQPGTQLPGPQAAPMPPAIGPSTAQSLLQNPAIAQSLLGSLGGGQDQQPQGQPGLFHRVVGNLLGIPHAIASHAGPPLPPEYQVAVQMGLIPQAVADAARPQFLTNITDPDAYRNNLDRIMGVMSTGRTLQETQRQLAARHAMADLFPQPTPTGDPIKDHDNMANWLASQFGYATSHNLPDIAKDMESALRGVMSVPPPVKNQIVPQGGAVVGPDGKPLYTAPVLPKQYEPIPFVDKNGNNPLFVDPATGLQINGQPIPAGYRNAAQARTEITVQGALERAAQTAANGGRGGATGLGSAGIGGVARQAAAIVGLNNANERMLPFEQAVASKQANYTGLDYWQGMRAKMYDAKGIKDEAIHADIYAKLNQENPELANYLVSAEQWALEDSQLSGRPSDFRTKLDAFVSAIGPRAGNKMIAGQQKFRATRLEELNKARVAMEAIMARVAGSTGGAPTTAAPAALPMSSATPTPTGGRTVTVKGKTYRLPD